MGGRGSYLSFCMVFDLFIFTYKQNPPTPLGSCGVLEQLRFPPPFPSPQRNIPPRLTLYASNIRPTSIKNRCQHRSKNRCLSRSISEPILEDFGKEHEGKLAPKNRLKSMKILKKSLWSFLGPPGGHLGPPARPAAWPTANLTRFWVPCWLSRTHQNR